MSAFVDIYAVQPQAIWDGLLARAIHGDRITLSLIELDPGATVPEHRHENEQMGILLQGSVAFTIGEEAQEFGPGGTWTVRANVPHSVVTGPNGALLVEAFSPARTDWDVHEQLEPRPGLWPF